MKCQLRFEQEAGSNCNIQEDMKKEKIIDRLQIETELNELKELLKQ
jgi:hypothetical protein